MAGLPKEYEHRLRSRLMEGLFGAYPQALVMYPFRNILIDDCAHFPPGNIPQVLWDDTLWMPPLGRYAVGTPFPYTKRHRLFYYLDLGIFPVCHGSAGSPGGEHRFPVDLLLKSGTGYCIDPVQDGKKR